VCDGIIVTRSNDLGDEEREFFQYIINIFLIIIGHIFLEDIDIINEIFYYFLYLFNLIAWQKSNYIERIWLYEIFHYKLGKSP
jgi:hypothetical protein